MNSAPRFAMNPVRLAMLGGIAALLLARAVRAAEAPLADAAESGSAAAVGRLLDERAQVNAPQADGMTALHWAAYHDDLQTAKRLLAAGADAKAANRYGVTPLSLASTNGSAELVELLLDAGADANTSLAGGEAHIKWNGPPESPAETYVFRRRRR
jgi:ankyrin repeat protein